MSRSTSTRGSDSYSETSDETSSRNEVPYSSAPRRFPFSQYSNDTDDTFPVANVSVHHDGPSKELVLYIVCGSTVGIVLASLIVWSASLSFNFVENKIFEAFAETILPLTKLSDGEEPAQGILGYLQHIWLMICKFIASRLKSFIDTYA